MFRKLFLVTFTTLLVVQSKESNNHVSEIWGSTDIKISRLKYTWTINNLKLCCPTLTDVIKSPTFSTTDGCNWNLHIRPKGETELVENYVALSLDSINCDSNTAVKLSILNARGEQSYVSEFSHKYHPGEGWGYNSFILQSELFKEENGLLPDNHLTIICEITVTVGKENSFGKHVQPKRHLLEDFGLLLENEVLTDVTLMAGGKEFKAHKAILAARSAVFQARLAESRNDSLLEIVDVEPKALGAMLRYIYSNEKVCNLTKLAPDLLAAAETFQLNGLKTMCENTLRLNLAIENAVDFYILADRYRAVELKKEARKFIAIHASEISNTTGFKSLTLAQPRLATEVFDLFG